MTTKGMAENYNSNSKYQEDVFDFGKPILLKALDTTILPGNNEAFSIADYGCSHGQNSIRAVKFIIETIFKRNKEHYVVVVHNDLPTNDFNQVFQNLYQSPASYLNLRSTGIWPLCSGASFYQPILPVSSIHCGMSCSAVHWLSKLPNIHFPDGVFLSQANSEILQTVLQIAAADWRQFLMARSMEIAPGGILFIQAVGRRRSVITPNLMQTTSADLFIVINDIMQTLIKKKLLRADVYDRFIFPVVPRSLDEVLLPLQTDLKQLWVCEHASIDEVPNPYLNTLQKTHNTAQYAKDYNGFIKAFTQSTFYNHLFSPGAINTTASELENNFYNQLQHHIEANPEAGIFHAYMITLLLRRV